MPLDPWQSAGPRGRGTGARNRQQGHHRQDDDSGLSLFDDVPEADGNCDASGLEEGRRRRDDGARVAELNTWGPWKVKALAELQRWCRDQTEGTSDDLIDAVGEPPLSSTGAVGALMQGAARRGLIENTGQYVMSRRPSANARRIAVWQGTGATPRGAA